MDWKRILKKTWYFIWEEDSLLSWIANVILAFVIVKFIFYPGLGLLLGTSHPVVAVVSGSMEHNGTSFDLWWDQRKDNYDDFGISKEEFLDYRFRNGFNKGDLMVLVGAKDIKEGDALVFIGDAPGPIIHRVVKVDQEDSKLYIQTMGDNNSGSRPDEFGITRDRVVGKAVLRVPYLGWVKLGFLMLIGRA